MDSELRNQFEDSQGDLRVTEMDVIDFSKAVRGSGIPAWQRLEAVRMIGTYRDSVLRTDEPSWQNIRHMPGRLVYRQNVAGQTANHVAPIHSPPPSAQACPLEEIVPVRAAAFQPQ
jgi:hypothetical protein